jgi:hypothetical protein
MPQQVPGTVNSVAAGGQPLGMNLYGQANPDGTKKKNAEVVGQPAGMPMNPLGSLMPQGGGTQGQEMSPYGTPVTYDADRHGFTNADGGHDWLPGYGPGGDFGGQPSKTGQAAIGTDPGSGDALGIPRHTPEYRAAQAAHQARMQQNLGAGRTLADLGRTPTKGGGLAAFMQLGSLFHPGTGQPTNPVAPAGPTPAGPTPTMPLGPITAPGPGNKTNAPINPGFVNNSGIQPGQGQTPGIVPSIPGQVNPLQAQKRKIPQPMGSLGFGASPINTARVM